MRKSKLTGRYDKQGDDEAAVTRREFVKKAGIGAGGLALAATLPMALSRTASAADSLKVGFISPLTGPLASFGESDPFILAQVRKALSVGITVGGKKYAVEIRSEEHPSELQSP